NGFTLIEVLLALAVLAIALTALLKATSQDVNYTQRIKERTISHWVAMQGVSAIQLGLITIPAGQPITEVTSMLNQNWYWRAQLL
ncbi:type II secretion system minor pseudopilin GspI, partial [Alicyclobacillus cellulosilyticus]